MFANVLCSIYIAQCSTFLYNELHVLFIDLMCTMCFFFRSTTLMFILCTVRTCVFAVGENCCCPCTCTPQPDERRAFSQWIAARMSGIPHDRWDDFQLAAMRLMQDYSSPQPNPYTSPSPTAQPRPMTPVQQQWPHFPQQQQQWGPMQTWQQQ